MSKKLAHIIIMKLFAISGLTFAQDQTIPLVQYPAGSASIEPAPNVIISVDDSGSMGDDGIKSLKDALKETFSETNIPDKRLRLAWQSMNGCKNLPDSKCQNGLKILDKTHRKSFLDWVDTLNANGGTPSHKMIRNAGDYLSRSKESFNSKPEDWPWSEIPGTKVGDVLACRKSFHIFMTDGSWNSGASSTSSHIDADRDLQAYKTIEGNLDGAERILPDGTKYNPDDPNLKIYKDDWGGSYSYSITTCARRDWWGYCTGYKTETIEDSINTLSDLAFHYWAKDLQPGIPNSVKPIIKVESDETITKNGKSVTFTPYWNPKNNPATWQSLTTYTIGFGTATNWNKSSNNNQQLLTWSGDTYSGSYYDLALGTINWPSPLCGVDHNNRLRPDINGTIACDGSTLYGAHNEIGNRRTELWHMAINSRGKFIPAKTSEDLKKAFSDIVNNIIEDTSQPITGFSSSSGSISTQETTAYVSTYDARGWKGGIYSQQVAQESAKLSANPDWKTRPDGKPLTTADKLDEKDYDIRKRLILTSNNAGKGINFDKDSISSIDKKNLIIRRSETATPGITEDEFLQNTIDFLRGDTTLDGKNSGNIPFRKRDSRQGDIVNSAIWYVGAPNQGYRYQGYADFSKRHANRLPMLYVGGNDGMLHGFSAIDGTEKIAYIPRGVIKNLHLLTKPEYKHRYFVDGSAFTGDIDADISKNSAQWKTMLVGTLGAGGKGYFVLDVTSPGSKDNTGVTSNFNKENAETLVVLDKTETNDPDIGHIFSEPVTTEYNHQITTQIAKLNNGRWAAVMGNGYNSINQRPVLLIQYLDGDNLDDDKSLVKITAGTSATHSTLNGLGAPRLVDINDDGMPDIVYAGDLKGNMWKFNISSADDKKWGVAFDGKPLFTAEHKQGKTSWYQPITTAPLVRANRSAGGLMVAFGTGRHLTEGDRTDTSIQSFYSVRDNTRYVIKDGEVTVSNSDVASPISGGRGELFERTFNSTPIPGSGTSSHQTFWNMREEKDDLTYSGAEAKRGWFFDFPEVGERVIRHPRFYVAGSNIIEILSDVPASGGNTEGETCEPTSTPAKAWRTLLGIEFGKRPTQQILDANGDGLYNTLDDNTNRVTAPPKELALGGKGEQIRIGPDRTSRSNELSRPTSTVNWRQMR